MVLDHILRFYLPQEIQQLLSSADRKRRYYDVSASVKGLLYYLGERFGVVFGRLVPSVSVGRLHYYIVSLIDILRVTDKRLLMVSDVTREQQLSCLAVLCKPKLDACRAEQVSRIGIAHLYAIAYVYLLIVFVRHKAGYRSLCVSHCIKRLNVLAALAPALSGAPLGFKLLDMRRIAQHYRAQVAGRFCSVYLSREAACIQQRQQSRVVDVSVGEQHKVNAGGWAGDFLVLKVVYALLHAEIDKEFLSAGFDIGTASCDLVGSAEEYKFHKDGSPRFICFN